MQARKKLYDVYGEKSITERQCQNWFARFKKHNTTKQTTNNLVTLRSSIFGFLHISNEIQLTKRISICDSLQKRNETDPFLKRIIRGDEKWVFYDNVVRKRSWSKRDEPAQSTSKADIHQKKVMLSV